MAARFFFRFAMDAGLIDASPAARLSPPRRHPSLRRPLTPDELTEVWVVASTTGMDPELDTRVLTLLRHTACRRSGALGLTRDAMDRQRGAVRLTEKYGHTRVQPLSRRIIEDLDAFAVSRGAMAGHDNVFRYRNGNPLTRRRFNSLFDRVDRHTSFTEALDVSAHWIRHTTLADIAAASDLRVATAFAGHAPERLGVIGTYTLVTFDDLCEAYEAVFGDR
jgi:site-specific recombinase XerD